MGNLFHGPTPFVILFVVLLLFGAPKLPALAKSLGQSMKILKKEVSTSDNEKPDDVSELSAEEQLEQAKAEVTAAKAEADALRAAAELRSEGKSEA